jgi:hypothetical protein
MREPRRRGISPRAVFAQLILRFTQPGRAGRGERRRNSVPLRAAVPPAIGV